MKLKLIIPLIFLNFTLLLSQTDFEKIRVYDNTNNLENPFKILLEDLDFDGDLDIITTANNSLYWFENQGDDKFSSPIRIGAAYSRSANISIFDLDGDGLKDIVVGSGWSGHKFISWHKRQSENTQKFDDRETISSSAWGIRNMKIKDVDLDGDLDILAPLVADDRIAWFENRFDEGLGLSKHELGFGASGASSIDFIDMDGDSDLDVIYTAFNIDLVAWYENTGGAEFNQIKKTVTTQYENPDHLNAEDLNKDGTKDFVFISGIEDIIAVNFIDQQNSSIQSEIINIGADINRYEIYDYNNDGWLDIGTYSQSNDQLVWYTNNQGSFDNSSSKTVNLNNNDSYQLAFGDINGDGKFDIISRNSEENSIRYLKSNGNNSFSYPKELNNNHLSEPSFVQVGDIDGDLDSDIVLGFKESNRVGWIENIDNYFESQKLHLVGSQYSSIDEVILTDFNNDNKLDLMIATNLDDDIKVFRNKTGVGDFLYNGKVSNNITIDIEVADIRNDGAKMIVINRGSTSNIAYTGYDIETQQHTSLIEIPNSKNTDRALESFDIDNDGDVDIVACGFSNFNPTVCFENEDGKFEESFEIPQNTQCSQIYSADLNGDSFDDLILYSYNSLRTMLNNGDKTFNDPESLDFDGIIREIYLIDYDHDNDIDILGLANNSGSNEIFWIENIDSKGGYGVKQILIESFDDITSIIPFDFDFDGDFDIITTRIENDAVDLFLSGGSNKNTLNGRVLYDSLGNNCQTSRLPVENIIVNSSSSQFEESSFSQQNGYFQQFPSNATITSSITSQLPSHFNPNQTIIESVFDEENIVSNIEFCIEPANTFMDHEIIGNPVTEFRPGFDAKLLLQVKNNGTHKSNGILKLEFNKDQLIILDSNTPYEDTTPGEIEISIAEIEAFRSQDIIIEFRLAAPPELNNGENIRLNAQLFYTIDEIIENDSTTINIVTIGSYDPNDISVKQGPKVLIDDKGEYLDYLIRFQNTGTASAINVSVENQIDELLDLNTLNILSSSHRMELSISEDRNLTFDFNNIYLQDSTTNLEESNGYIVYRIKPIEQISVGNIIKNSAQIYFDFNLPIYTNEVQTKYTLLNSLKNNLEDQVSLYPNPAKNIFNISSTHPIQKVVIYNMNGNICFSDHFSNTKKETINTSDFNPGIYTVKVSTKNSSFVRRLLIN